MNTKDDKKELKIASKNNKVLGKGLSEIMKASNGVIKNEDIDFEKMMRRAVMKQNINSNMLNHMGNVYDGSTMSRQKGLRSLFYSPLMLDTHNWGNIHTISPYYGRTISYRILRRVSEKAWILNLCIINLIRKIRPFLKQSTNENVRGFRITLKDAEYRKKGMTEEEKKIARELEDFFLKTGDANDSSRTDDLDKYVSKIVRDICQLDQISTEIQRTRSGEVCAFWAIDPATIEVALPMSAEQTGIKYAQVVDNVPYAYYGNDDLVFDCLNPRTDIERSGYGYSIVEQVIDLITSSINTFMFNAGFFTENKLPRGMLLLDGDVDLEETEMIEDYIVNLMSGPPSSQWRIPIIPSGSSGNSESNRKFQWVSLQGNNREMEFQAWFDLQLSGIVGMFGFQMEDIGLRSQKSSPLIGNDVSPKMESSKSLVLGDILGFLQKHFNQILSYKNPDYKFEFVGYEKDDPKLTLDIDKGEVESYKSVDEKRKEKGLKPYNKKWSTIPLNQQIVQLVGQEEEEEEEDSEGDLKEQDISDNQNVDVDNKKSDKENHLNVNDDWDNLTKSVSDKEMELLNIEV